MTLLIPNVIGLPDLEADGEVSPGLRDKGPFRGMGNVHPCYDIDFLGYPLVDQDSVPYLHRGAAILLLFHAKKLASLRPARKFFL